MLNNFAGFLKDESAATAIEYSVIAGLISIVIVGGAKLVGTNVAVLYNQIGGAF